MNSNEIRTRFAPSPTGYLHVGGLRTALYNYLFARKHNGKFILRIEDTDRNRYVEGAIENLISTLKWAGLSYDEGPDIGGPYGPYIQSQRLSLYKAKAEEVIKKQKAYRCFCSQERLEKLREEQSAKGEQPKYDKRCLYLSQTEIEEKLKNNEPYVVRLNVDPNCVVEFHDLIRERVVFEGNTIDDQVLLKSDGYPTYHLANVVDDHEMKITHVIRGEEWLSSTPKHILLYEAFGWNKPFFAHVPLLLNPDRSKLSKRQGDVAAEAYRDKGYMPEAMINFLALLGWNAGDYREFYTLEELIKAFSIERVHKAGAIFNLDKLNWLNAEHIRRKSTQELLPKVKEELQKSEFANSIPNDETLMLIIEAMKERVQFIKDFIYACPYFYVDPIEYDQEVIEKRWSAETRLELEKFCENLNLIENPSKEDYEKILQQTCESLGIKKAKIIHPIRLAVSGIGTGPGLYDILYIIGKQKTIERIRKAVEKIKK